MSKNVSTGFLANSRRRKAKSYEGPVKSKYKRFLLGAKADRKSIDLNSK